MNAEKQYKDTFSRVIQVKQNGSNINFINCRHQTLIQAKMIGKIQLQTSSISIQRKVGEESNVVFGLNGKDEKAIDLAVKAGYTTFDAGDTYGNTLAELASCIAKNSKKREDIEIVYKIAVTPPGGLVEHIEKIISSLKGYIDCVLVHDIGVPEGEVLFPLLQQLKRDGKIKCIGVGEVKETMISYLKDSDCFEVNAISILQASSAKELATILKSTDKPVFVYNIIGVLKQALKLGQYVLPTFSQINGAISFIKSIIPKAEPILSSSKEENINLNKVILENDPEDWGQAGEGFNALDYTYTHSVPFIEISKMDKGVWKRISSILSSKVDWAKSSLFKDEQTANAELLKVKELFSPSELSSYYKDESGKIYNLGTLLEMLYTLPNCKRVEAYNILTERFI